MTEQEWLTSEDPAKMLDFATHQEHNNRWHHAAVSERKLRLFACAITRSMVLPSDIVGIAAIEDAADWRSYDWSEPPVIPLGGGGYWCAEPDVRRGLEELLRGGNSAEKRATQANLLRDIVGNPFRPLALESAYLEDAHTQDAIIATRRHGEKSVRSRLLPGTWLTPIVLSLAQAAYQERSGQKCEMCRGNGGANLYECGRGPWIECGRCKGTGCIEDGTLDPVRLSILADALEEGGCDSEELLQHLHGQQRCPRHEPDLLHCRRCGSTQDRRFYATHPSLGYAVCGPCDTGEPLEKWPCPSCKSVGWVSLPGPHVRGCWALDLILGKE